MRSGSAGNSTGRPATARLGVARAAHEKHRFHVGQVLAGRAEPLADPRVEAVDDDKVSGHSMKEGTAPAATPPAWHGAAPPLEVHGERDHRRLAARAYASAPCSSCIRGAHMAVGRFLDHWNPDRRKYGTEAGWVRRLGNVGDRDQETHCGTQHPRCPIGTSSTRGLRSSGP